MKTGSKTLRSNIITYGLVVVFYIVMQGLYMTDNLSSLMEGLMVPLCYYMILAVSLNLVVGISGELSLGHAGFMCVGAFSSAVFARLVDEKIPGMAEIIIAILIGAAFAAIFGFLIGIPVLRLKGDYLAIVTLAFGEIIKNLINAVYLGVDANGLHVSLKDTKSLNLLEDGDIIIKGAQGIGKLPRNATFTIGIILLLITLFIVINLVNSRQGRAIMSIRDNRIAAESIGLSVSKYKLTAFVISAALAGVAGVLYSHNLANLQATSKNFGYNQSIMILVFVVLGGIGNIRGSMIAAVILTILPEKLRFLNDYRMLIYAIVLIAMMILNSAPKVVAWRKVMAEKYFPHKGKINEPGEA
jgi:ABC-type branched-subunit amino acid transport system permease subunit